MNEMRMRKRRKMWCVSEIQWGAVEQPFGTPLVDIRKVVDVIENKGELGCRNILRCDVSCVRVCAKCKTLGGKHEEMVLDKKFD